MPAAKDVFADGDMVLTRHFRYGYCLFLEANPDIAAVGGRVQASPRLEEYQICAKTTQRTATGAQESLIGWIAWLYRLGLP